MVERRQELTTRGEAFFQGWWLNMLLFSPPSLLSFPRCSLKERALGNRIVPHLLYPD